MNRPTDSQYSVSPGGRPPADMHAQYSVQPGVINRGANLFSRPIHCACIASSLQAHALQRLSVGYECMRAAEFRKIRTLEPKFYLSVMHARETDEILQQMHACCLLFPAHACLADQLIRCARSARQTARQTLQSMRIQIEESRTPVDYSWLGQQTQLVN